MHTFSFWLFGILILSMPVANAADMHFRAWEIPSVPIIIDPYYGNPVDFDKVKTDPRVRAMIHKAGEGSEIDPKVVARAEEARKIGLLWGVYWLGRTTPDTKKQAELLLEVAKKTNAKFLALDIEHIGGTNMTLEEAQKFAKHIFEATGRYPALYTNFSTYGIISQRYDSSSVFAKMLLWIARFGERTGMNNARVWKDYRIWQFSSEINCKRGQTNCFYNVPGTKHDMDINVFNGSYDELKVFFQ